MSDDDRQRAQREASERQHERAETVEHIVRTVEDELDDPKYPVRREELSDTYAVDPDELPNETESLGDVEDRTGEPIESRDQLLREVRDTMEHGDRTQKTVDPKGHAEEIAGEIIREVAEADSATFDEE
jgi:hypothetical protein